jgi:hypothetical protein
MEKDKNGNWHCTELSPEEVGDHRQMLIGMEKKCGNP